MTSRKVPEWRKDISATRQLLTTTRTVLLDHYESYSIATADAWTRLHQESFERTVSVPTGCQFVLLGHLSLDTRIKLLQAQSPAYVQMRSGLLLNDAFYHPGEALAWFYLSAPLHKVLEQLVEGATGLLDIREYQETGKEGALAEASSNRTSRAIQLDGPESAVAPPEALLPPPGRTLPERQTPPPNRGWRHPLGPGRYEDFVRWQGPQHMHGGMSTLGSDTGRMAASPGLAVSVGDLGVETSNAERMLRAMQAQQDRQIREAIERDRNWVRVDNVTTRSLGDGGQPVPFAETFRQREYPDERMAYPESLMGHPDPAGPPGPVGDDGEYDPDAHAAEEVESTPAELPVAYEQLASGPPGEPYLTEWCPDLVYAMCMLFGYRMPVEQQHSFAELFARSLGASRSPRVVLLRVVNALHHYIQYRRGNHAPSEAVRGTPFFRCLQRYDYEHENSAATAGGGQMEGSDRPEGREGRDTYTDNGTAHPSAD
jgi:hypothetical protein